MKNEKVGTTLTLPTALIEECKRIYGAVNCSAAIICALADFLLLPLSEQKLDTFALHQLFPNIGERRNMQKLPIRIPRRLYDVIMSLSGDNNFSQTVERMLSRTLYIVSRQAHSMIPCSKPIYVWGNKWKPLIQVAISHIKDTAQATWDTCVETCAGGLGIYSNFQFADTEILNDCDWNIINLYKAIQENPRELIMWARSLQVDTTTFKQQKALFDYINTSSKIDYEAAARYLFLNINSYKNKCGTPNNHMSDSKYRKALTAIYPLHRRLNQCANPHGKVTKLCNADIFKIIKKYQKQSRVLFIVDPPYLDADLYNPQKSEFGEEEHERLAKLLRLVKENKSNDFIYFCRITAPKRYQSLPNAGAHNCHMRGCIDDLYYGYGFFYIDIPLDDGAVERIITSFNFDGATPYGRKKERHDRVADTLTEFSDPHPCASPLVEMGVE